METNQTSEVGKLTTKVGIWSCLTRKHSQSNTERCKIHNFQVENKGHQTPSIFFYPWNSISSQLNCLEFNVF